MRKATITLVCLLTLGMAQAQTVSKKTVDQYRQLVTLNRQPLKTFSDQLAKWDYVYHKDKVIDLYGMQFHGFTRAEGQDSVGALLITVSDQVFTVSGIFSSYDAVRTFKLISKASELQQQMAKERKLTKYTCKIKGKVKNKKPQSHTEMLKVLAEAGADAVSKVEETWESTDGKQKVQLTYENKRFGKKKPKADEKVELTIAVADTRE